MSSSSGFYVGNAAQLPCAITISLYPGIVQVLEAGTEITYTGWTNALAPLWFIEQYLKRYKLAQVYWDASGKGMQAPCCNMIVPQGYAPDPALLEQLPAAFLRAIGYHQVQLPLLTR